MTGRWLEILGCAAVMALPSCTATAPHVEPGGRSREAAVAPAAPAPAGDAAPAASWPPPATLPPDAEAPPAHPFHAPLEARRSVAGAAATRYASLSPSACQAELRKRALPFQRARRAAPGVATPIQLTGPLQGVEFSAPGGKSVHGILDCRLALALDDVARILARHGVARVRVDNFYRPSRGRAKRRRSQHAVGLAMDLMEITLHDARTLEVQRDWRGARGEPVCGPEAQPTERSEATIALRNIVCEVAREGLFHRVLTPNYDAAHESHLHLDIARDAKAMTVR